MTPPMSITRQCIGSRMRVNKKAEDNRQRNPLRPRGLGVLVELPSASRRTVRAPANPRDRGLVANRFLGETST